MDRSARLLLAGLICAPIGLFMSGWIAPAETLSSTSDESSAPGLLSFEVIAGSQSIHPERPVLRILATPQPVRAVAPVSIESEIAPAVEAAVESSAGGPLFSFPDVGPSSGSAPKVGATPKAGFTPNIAPRFDSRETPRRELPVRLPAVDHVAEPEIAADSDTAPQHEVESIAPIDEGSPDDYPLPKVEGTHSSVIVRLPAVDEQPAEESTGELLPLPAIEDESAADTAPEVSPDVADVTFPQQSEPTPDSEEAQPVLIAPLPAIEDPQDAQSQPESAPNTEPQLEVAPLPTDEPTSEIVPLPAVDASQSEAPVPHHDITPLPPTDDITPADTAAPTEASPSAADARAMQVVSQRAAEHVCRGFSLANRGAHFTARIEFIRAMRLISQSLDAAGGKQHGDALAAGLRALDESDDFVPRGSRVEADVDVTSLISAHRTPVLKEVPADELTLLMARQRYYTYAQQQLAVAVGHERSGSMALYGLARVQMAQVGSDVSSQAAATPKAMALHQAALRVDGDNYMAANELGVMLARYGQLEAARTLLARSVQVAPQAVTWNNLAKVHDRLGETALSAAARERARALTTADPQRPATANSSTNGIVWTSPNQFAQTNGGEIPAMQSAPKSVAKPAAQAPVAKSAASWFPWSKSSQ